MRILIADEELANSKLLRPLFAAGGKGSKQTAKAGASHIGKVVVARAPKKVAKGRAGAMASGGTTLDLGDEPEHSSAILDALGLSLLNKGLFDEGSKLILLALQIRRKAFGNDHPLTAQSLNSYSRVQRESGNYKGATDAAQDALRINRRVFGDGGYPVAISLKELGLVQLLQGQFSDAVGSASAGLAILKSVGVYDNDPNSTRLMDVLGRAQANLRLFEDADDTYETLLKLDRKQLGTRNNQKYATHLANYGLVKEGQKKRKQAAAFYRNAIEFYGNSLNRWQHPNLIDTYANLGSLLRTPPAAPADLKEAGKYLEKALETGILVRGEGHTLVGNDYANLARWFHDNDDTKAASKHFEKARNIYTANIKSGSLPENHYFVAEVLTWQGRIAVEAATPTGAKNAEPLLREALRIWPAQLGPGSLGESMAKGYLGRALGLQREDDPDACRLLCDGYNEVKANPLGSADVLAQFKAWIEEQGCDCSPSRAT